MRIQITDNSVKLWLSADDTYSWAHRPGKAWPGSTLANKRLLAVFDANGLCNLTINGRASAYPDVSATELNAITHDFLRDKLPADHPLYYITVGQFDNNPQTRR